MTETTYKHRADRFPISSKVYCSFERVGGTATLANISYTGVLVESTAMRPEIGTPIKLYVYLKPPRVYEMGAPTELTAAVARHSSDGFAVKFKDNHNPHVRRMVDEAAAVIAPRR